MSRYRRAYAPGGCFFFTVVTFQRRRIFADPSSVRLLREAFRHVRQRRPFQCDAIVVLPDHLHCIWQLPPADSDYSGRWREIKKFVSRRLTAANPGEVIWQPRFWEHTLKDEHDWQRHFDYIHYNPVKHGWAATPSEWPWSSFHTAVKHGWYEWEWGAGSPPEVASESWE
ncbi:MAG: transposase [Halomonas sp.]|uniref:REP-associated tyrosine transposase n=1 Tax=Halomonas sp. TaxID=1486246 RepID=UPI001823D421|nr:transposase [Halomonas sp.]NWN83857.1 transposase [Halomonas sp.]